MGRGKKEKRERQIGYRRSGKRSVEKAETKAFSNRERYILLKNLSAQCSVLSAWSNITDQS
jgi:hypothetical protein